MRFTGRSSSIACYSDFFRSNIMSWFNTFALARGSATVLVAILFAAQLTAANTEMQTRLKDLVTLEGMRDNQLVGYGLVVGLAGTGDKRTTVFSTQSLANMLQRMGVTVDPTAIQIKNTAAVMVTATLPAFAQPGTHIDVTASAIGDAGTLQGGILILTSLRGANGQVYATAQGPVVTGGFAVGRARQQPDRQSPDSRARPEWRHRGARRSITHAVPESRPSVAPVRLHDRGPHRRGRQ